MPQSSILGWDKSESHSTQLLVGGLLNGIEYQLPTAIPGSIMHLSLIISQIDYLLLNASHRLCFGEKPNWGVMWSAFNKAQYTICGYYMMIPFLASLHKCHSLNWWISFSVLSRVSLSKPAAYYDSHYLVASPNWQILPVYVHIEQMWKT